LIGLFRPSFEFDSLNLVIRMVETGNCTTNDLVDYLVSIQPTLTSQEFEYLRQVSAFPKETAGREQSAAGASRKVRRYKAKDLYEPIDIIRELGLPTIDWGADVQWESKSNNGKLLLWAVVEDPSDLPIAQPVSCFYWV
jgi:Protein of unknown function (DUF3684)